MTHAHVTNADASRAGPHWLPIGVAIITISLFNGAARAQSDPNADLAGYVEKVRQTFNVPGIAVAVIKNGKVALEQGFGVRNLADATRVDIHTMFCIASNTKSVTATAVEILADQGKLKMDDRVIDRLPWFRMSEPYASGEIRVRDLLAHRSGLGSHEGDLLFVTGTAYSTREVVEKLQMLPLESGFRGSFAYENIMYAVATLLIEEVSGQSYADFVREHIFEPVQMNESRIDASYLKQGENFATAYIPEAGGNMVAIPALVWRNSQGAAGIYSSVHDMAKWVAVQLDGGLLPEERGPARRLISAEAQRRMWSTITPIEIDEVAVPQLQAAQPNFLGYAEGWYLSDYRGHRTVWHDGGFPGTVSLVTMIPELKLGVIVLTNQQSEDSLRAITWHIVDGYLGAPETDWINAYAASSRLMREKVAEADARQSAAHSATRPPLTLDRYAGLYRDAWFGDVEVVLHHDQLRVRCARAATDRLDDGMARQCVPDSVGRSHPACRCADRLCREQHRRSDRRSDEPCMGVSRARL